MKDAVKISYYHTEEWTEEYADTPEEVFNLAFDIISMIESDEDGAVVFDLGDRRILVEHSDGSFHYDGIDFYELEDVMDEVTMAICYAW